MSYATNGESGMSRTISGLGKGLGGGAALLGTTAIHPRIEEPLFHFFSKAWGPVAAKWLTWAMCGVEAVALYNVTALVFSALVIGAMTAYAARRS